MATRNLGLRFGVSVLAVAISGIIIGSHRVGVVGANADDGLSTSKYHPDAGVVGEEAIGIIGGIGARGEEELLESKNKVWTLEEIYQELQECHIVKTLNSQAASSSSTDNEGPFESPSSSSFMHTLFSYLFPLGPAGNALLATAYISGPPNFLLALVPPDIDPSRLSIMVAFAIGGLLGDTLLHLIPGSFLGGEDEGEGSAGHSHGVEFVIKNDRKNLLIGGMIMVGFVVFVAMDKALRVAGMRVGTTAGNLGGHGHSYSTTAHGHSQGSGTGTGADGTIKSSGELRKRKGGDGATNGAEQEDEEEEEKQQVQEVKMSSYLNIIADFSHNITDGLAMSAAFYASPLIGATTTIGVFFHEIPHEVGDFALLVQSGFTKWQAMGAQFVTAIGAFIGTLIGIAIQHFSSYDATAGAVPWNGGIWSTGLTPGDLVLPFTAGTFLYVGFSAVPEVLQVDETRSRAQEITRSLCQLLAMAAGFAIMVFVS